MSEKEKQNFLRDVQDFWEKDVEIKKILMDLLKAESSMNGVYQMQRYVNLLRRTTNSLEGIFKKMIPLLKGIPSNLMLDFVTKFFAQIQMEIESCDCTAPGIHKLVTTRFSDMKESFLNVVNQNCVACYLWFDLKSIVKECTSINELLHFYHAYIINNLDYTQVFPLISKKNNVILCGNSNSFSEQIFNKFPDDIDSSYVNIFSCTPELVFMIVRDYGHATSLKISQVDNGIDIEYFIPKAINFDKIAKLPGISRMNASTQLGWATGFFHGEIDDLGNFIRKIPTDMDYEIKY